MKNIYLFLLLSILIGCGTNPLKRISSTPTNCPSILFAKEHKIYIDSQLKNISLDNITYKAEINNAAFNKGCHIKANVFSSELSILFIVNPLTMGQKSINLPFYLAILDEDKKVYDIQYYSTEGSFKQNLEDNSLIETEIITIIDLSFNSVDKFSTLVIGFMLDKERLELLN